MGFKDKNKTKNQTPAVSSILSDAAKQEILAGRLPILKTSKVFLKKGEQCHYVDQAVYEKKTVQKKYVRSNNGFSVPGPKGTSFRVGGGQTNAVDQVQYVKLNGILYITNQRIIFVGEQSGFDQNLDHLIAATPYTNGIILQFSKDTYKLFVPDGSLVHMVLQRVK